MFCTVGAGTVNGRFYLDSKMETIEAGTLFLSMLPGEVLLEPKVVQLVPAVLRAIIKYSMFRGCLLILSDFVFVVFRPSFPSHDARC